MRTLIALVVAASASAQVSAPLLGWLPDGRGIRRISGLPAAATLGPAIDSGGALERIAVSPRQDYVLASDATGAVLLIQPGSATASVQATPRPDLIAISPVGSAAILWYASSRHFEIVSGLPASPAVRQLSASFLPGPAAIAVSDDGQSIAAASPAGVYEWGPGGSPAQIYSGADASALAFFSNSSNLAVATSTQVLSIGSSPAILEQGSFSPAGLALSFDNSKAVLADASGAIYSIDLAGNPPATFDCACKPDGVFGLGGAVFRLTSSTRDAIKLFDASAGAILAIPGEPVRKSSVVHPAQTAAPLPALTINLSPNPTGYLQQPAMTISASSAYASEIDGTVTLSFASSVGGNDQMIQFSTGGATVNFVIAAGSTQATFSGNSKVTFSTGTVAGTTTLTADVTAPTPTSAVATKTVTTNPTVPFISTVQFSQTTGGLTVVVTGFSSTRDMTSGLFHFAPSSNATIQTEDLTVSLNSAFGTWYSNSSSDATGSEFTLTVPFSVKGSAYDITAVTVTLTNSKGASNPVSP